MNHATTLLGIGASDGSGIQDQQVNQFDAGLCASQGADVVISMMKSRRFVHRLIIGHNELGDEGCQHLFSFLCSDEGRRHDIQEISLNANKIGDDGLIAISQYLKDNKRVRELFLQNNDLKGTPHATATFLEAVNSSSLEILSMTTNKHLSDPFLSQFLSSLNAPRLRELQFSAIGLSNLSGKVIATFLASSRCKLHVLKCNGNSLGLRGIKPIVRAIQSQNYTLRSIEMYANQLQNEEPDLDGIFEEETQDQSGKASDYLQTWRACENTVKKILLRNTHLKREVNRQSVTLLCYARPLLLQGKHWMVPVHNGVASLPAPLAHSQITMGLGTNTQHSSQLKSLPLELQHYILSFFAPSLSSSQRIRVLGYSTSVKTLPQLLPPLSSLARSVALGFGNGLTCIPDPSSIEFALGGTIWPVKINNNPFQGPCTVDRCMGSSNALLCRREKERIRFLEAVGCDAYELEPGEGAHSPRELYTLSLRT